MLNRVPAVRSMSFERRTLERGGPRMAALHPRLYLPAARLERKTMVIPQQARIEETLLHILNSANPVDLNVACRLACIRTLAEAGGERSFRFVWSKLNDPGYSFDASVRSALNDSYCKISERVGRPTIPLVETNPSGSFTPASLMHSIRTAENLGNLIVISDELHRAGYIPNKTYLISGMHFALEDLCFAFARMVKDKNEAQKYKAVEHIARLIFKGRLPGESMVHQAAVRSLAEIGTDAAFAVVTREIRESRIELHQSAEDEAYNKLVCGVLWREDNRGQQPTLGQINIYLLITIAEAMGEFALQPALSVLRALGKWVVATAQPGTSFLEQNVILSLSRFAERYAQSGRHAKFRAHAEFAREEFCELLKRAIELKDRRQRNVFVSAAYLKAIMAFYEAGLFSEGQAGRYIRDILLVQSHLTIRETAFSYLGRISPLRVMIACREDRYLKLLCGIAAEPYSHDPGSIAASEIDKLEVLVAGLGAVIESRQREFQAEARLYLLAILNIANRNTFPAAFYALSLSRSDGVFAVLENAYTLYCAKTNSLGNENAVQIELLEALAHAYGERAVNVLLSVLIEGRYPQLKARAAELLADVYARERDAIAA